MDEVKEPSGVRENEAMTLEEYREEMAKEQMASLMAHWPWYLILGIVLTVLGVVGLGMLPFLTLASIAVFGVFLIVGGIMLIFAGLFGRDETGGTRAFQLLLAVLYLAVGVTMVEEPLMSARLLTFILGGAFFIFGILKILMGFRVQKGGLVMFSGVIDFFIGGMILANWPEWSPWVIGIFIAVELIVAGASFIIISLGARSMKKEAEIRG